jgi:hypothetical protein
MSNSIKKFEEYSQDPLMDDIKDDINDNDEEFDPKEWEIDKVIDVLTEDPSKSEDERLKEFTSEAVTFDASVPKDVKRGDYLWITAMIKKKDTSYNNPGRQAVIKLRVVEIYYGLAHLNKVINK